MKGRQKLIVFAALALGFVSLVIAIGLFASRTDAATIGGATEGRPVAQEGKAEMLRGLMERPDPEGTPTVVKVGIYVIDISNVNDVNQTFSINLAVRLQWKDPRLATGRKGVVKKYKFDDVWNPNPILLKRRGIKEMLDDYVLVDDVGNVTHPQRFYGSLGFHHHLRDFPMDDHILPIEAVAGGYTPEEVKFVSDEDLTGQGEAFTIEDWTVKEGKLQPGTYYFKPTDKFFSMFTYKIEIERRAGFFIWRVIAPLLLIVFMSWMVFYIDPEHLEAQVGVSATSVLTLVAFQFAVGILLPRISYLTRMDFFMLVTSIMIFLALVEGVTTSKLATTGRKELALRIDHYSRICFPIAYLVFALIIFLV